MTELPMTWRPTPTGQCPPQALPETPLMPELSDIFAARQRLAGLLPPTPLIRHPRLDTLLGARTSVKLENTQPLGAFKVRGGLNLLAKAEPRERARGYVSATRGNHGQSLAFACARYGSTCTLFVPRGNDRAKNQAMRSLGARLIEAGDDFDEAWEAAREHARVDGAKLVHPGRHLDLIAGVGTLGLELVEQASEPLDAVFVPVGVGSCIVGVGRVLRSSSPHTQIIGVQAARAPAMTHAWRGEDPPPHGAGETLACGLAVGHAHPGTVAAMAELVDDMVLVDEADIARAIRWYATTIHQLAEGAGAAALAGAHALRHRFRGGHIAVLLTGGNIELARLRHVLHR